MPRDGTKNLVSQDKRTKDERKKIAQKGGIASGEARRERRALKDELLALLSDGDTQEKMCLALVRQAQRGNTKAFEIVRDTIGEKVAEKFEHSGETNNPFAGLTTDELRRMAGVADEDD